jgi:hypothetical protein
MTATWEQPPRVREKTTADRVAQQKGFHRRYYENRNPDIESDDLIERRKRTRQ